MLQQYHTRSQKIYLPRTRPPPYLKRCTPKPSPVLLHCFSPKACDARQGDRRRRNGGRPQAGGPRGGVERHGRRRRQAEAHPRQRRRRELHLRGVHPPLHVRPGSAARLFCGVFLVVLHFRGVLIWSDLVLICVLRVAVSSGLFTTCARRGPRTTTRSSSTIATRGPWTTTSNPPYVRFLISSFTRFLRLLWVLLRLLLVSCRTFRLVFVMAALVGLACAFCLCVKCDGFSRFLEIGSRLVVIYERIFQRILHDLCCQTSLVMLCRSGWFFDGVVCIAPSKLVVRVWSIRFLSVSWRSLSFGWVGFCCKIRLFGFCCSCNGAS